MITNSNNQSGLTVLELLVVLGITGILAIVSIPLFTSWIQKYRLTSAAENVYQTLQYARTEAIKRNTNIYVSFHTGDTWCYGVNSGSSCDCTVVSNCNMGTTSYLAAEQMDLTTSGLSGTYVYFEGTHAAASASGTITFTTHGLSTPLITIQVSRLGNLQFCTTGIDGYTAC